MSTSSSPDGPRLYGNWRRARGFGIANWSPGQTLTLFVTIVTAIAAFYIGVVVGLVVVGIGVLVAASVLIPVGGSSLWQALARTLRFSTARRRGWTAYSGGVLTDHPRQHDLPGPMAPLVPLNTDDGRGGKQGLLWDRRSGLITVVLRCSPVGLDLADQDQADQWVASWGAWLADLGYQPMVRWISVTVETAPTGGTTIRDYTHQRRSPHSPQVASQVMDELLAETPAVTADVDTRVSITFDPSRANPQPPDLLAAVAEVSRWIPGLEQGLASCGVSVLGRATVPQLITRLRTAYDPASRGEVAVLDAQQQVLAWRDAAPVSAREDWDAWHHDSGISVSWAMREAPRQAVTERVLVPLLAPGPHPRRVTLLYEPLGADAAAAAVESEISNLAVRQEWAKRTKRDTTQRDRDDAAHAQQAAREESQGAGVGTFSLYVTTTVAAAEQIPAAVADVELRAGQAKTRLRRLRGAQASGFAASLGMGINPRELETRHGY
ncbi:hypothetical protein FHX42_005197 [Saccharopolyspora lacisalsi]|uniref:PrgI family protein n=1 Tax=Halosaccharopolyspora lacisalsi TaxID=1000566 RepID=A0A839E422_9PSEU|nr:SCO6880 family protein [Halosaccharopolyspora lacisalsi]MBA8827790.1 hypothetical protein [Halosaccharopolyspora lacisalsi]